MRGPQGQSVNAVTPLRLAKYPDANRTASTTKRVEIASLPLLFDLPKVPT